MESTIEIYSPTWWENRIGKFTGSEIWKLMTEPRAKKDLMSKTAETYIREKVYEILSGQLKQSIDSAATAWGHENEPIAKRYYTDRTGNEVIESKLLISKNIEGLTGSPDGLVGEEGMIEVKCPFVGSNHLNFFFNEDTFESENNDYYYQMQCNLLLSGRKWCDFISFDPRLILNSDAGLYIRRWEANEEVQERMIDKVNIARNLFNDYLNAFKK
jgi:hypothetical protein